MRANKILLNGETLIDLTQDTVAADKMMKGATAHNKAGELIVGTYEVVIPEIKLQEKETSENGEIVPDSGYDGLSKVIVNVPVPEGYLVPTGIKEIVENGEYNIAEYEGVDINVPAPVLTYYDGSVTISGGATLISFTIDGDHYEAEDGMTWTEWLDSSYNTNGFETATFSGVLTVLVSGTINSGYGVAYNGAFVPVTDVIVADRAYEEKYGSFGSEND